MSQTPPVCGDKRKATDDDDDIEDGGGGESGAVVVGGGKRSGGQPAAKKRRVMFQDVTVYYFNRRQGFVCVPSQVSYNSLLKRGEVLIYSKPYNLSFMFVLASLTFYRGSQNDNLNHTD